jgi:hypothetical protein
MWMCCLLGVAILRILIKTLAAVPVFFVHAVVTVAKNVCFYNLRFVADANGVPVRGAVARAYLSVPVASLEEGRQRAAAEKNRAGTVCQCCFCVLLLTLDFCAGAYVRAVP